ncbi:MAG: glycogen/starch synthase [Erysipelotrichaceae bacterium]|nr:glycogen/starch synthase [Erysipelotrichaceae bacterium]
MKRVLFASFESLPFVKTGGLADVVYALPKALNKEEFEVKVVLPLYKSVKEDFYHGMKYLDHIYVKSGLINEEANIYSYINEGIEYYFIENDNYFFRDGVYGYRDDALRFSFFNVAVIEMMIKLDYHPDIIHEHDYHTAILPALCKLNYKAIEAIRSIKHVFTIHNLAYQGEYDKQILFDYLNFERVHFNNGDLRFNDSCNFMKIGIVYADIITTVSRTYAKEIQTPEYGRNLDMILKYRAKDLYGIVNGIDENFFNPRKDKLIPMTFHSRNYLKGKAYNKEYIQKTFGLRVDPTVMLVGVVSRLTFQKGFDLFLDSVNELLKRNIEVAVLGTGESRYEYGFKILEEQYKGKFHYHCGYDEKMAHTMYAGLDMLMMPSAFEPCGISQLIAMRYGTLPFVRETGGLKDTVTPYNEYENTGTGFSFGPYSTHDFIKVFDYAYTTYHDHRERWNGLIRNAMRADVSFAEPAKEYENLYRKVLEK